MKRRTNLLVFVALLMALSALLTACSAGQQGATTGPDVVRKMREALKSNQSAQGTVELSARLNKAGLKSLMGSLMPQGPKDMPVMTGKDPVSMLPDLVSITLKVWREASNKGRVEVESSTLPGMTGATLVYDGKKVYAYAPAHNKVYTKTPSDKEEMPGGMGNMLGEWAALTPEERGDRLVDASDVKMAGSEQVGGRDAYKLEVTPKAEAFEKLGVPEMFQMQAALLLKDAKATLWVDKERWVPLKVTLEHPSVGQFTYSATLELDKPIDASQFVLQTPPGAEVIDLDALHERMTPRTMTLAQARDEAAKDGWKLLEPSYLPEKATLIEVTKLPSMLAGPMGANWMPYFPDPTQSGQSIEGRVFVVNETPLDYLGWLWMPSISAAPMGGGMSMNGVGTTGPGPLSSNMMPPSSSTYMLNYSSPTADFSITESKSAVEPGLGDTFSGVNAPGSNAFKEVTVRGVKTTAFSPDGTGWTSLMWQDTSGISIAIRGKLSVEEAVKIAEGLR
jgi:outer membrane lipoprotein-sorting protein